MGKNISPLLADVKDFLSVCCFDSKTGGLYSSKAMRYGERLKRARVARGLTQAALSVASKVNQSLISQLENSVTATGSEYTNRLARALEISADWLADEIGEMVPIIYQTTDPKIIAAAKVMEPMPEYAKDQAVKSVADIEKLIAHRDGNGTEG